MECLLSLKRLADNFTEYSGDIMGHREIQIVPLPVATIPIFDRVTNVQ
jgi:hypothetical protein